MQLLVNSILIIISINNLSHIITQKSIYEVLSMSNSPKICIPPLNVSVVSVETMPVNIQSINSLPGTAGRLHLGKLAQQLMSIDENYCTESKPFVSCVPLQQNATPVYGVQLQPEQFLCVSCLHPNLLQESWKLSKTVNNSTFIPAQECILDKTKSNLLYVAPSMQVKVMFCSNTVEANSLPTTSNAQNGAKSALQEKIVNTHLFTASLPLKTLLQNLIECNGIVHHTVTSEDAGKHWQLHLSIADGKQLNTSETHTRNNNFRLQLDMVLAHEAWVKSQVGFCETMQEMASFVTAERMLRKTATSRVLKAFTNDELPSSWDLQMSRALGVVMTSEGPQTMKLDQQALEELRIGCNCGDQSQQTFLTFVNSLASAMVQIAQQADVTIGYDATTQLAVFDQQAFHNACLNFVAANGADALLNIVQLKCQENIVAVTTYQSDPEYTTVLQMKQATIDRNGSGVIGFDTRINLSANPGEDQRMSIAAGPEDSVVTSKGTSKGDCEDFANTLAGVTSLMKAFTEHDFLQSTQQALSYFPCSVQQTCTTLLCMAKALYTNENAKMSKICSAKQVPLNDLNVSVLQNAIAHAKLQPSVSVVSACSLLAKAQSIGQNNANLSLRDNTLAQTNINLSTFFNWWAQAGTQAGSQDNGLNGHSICVAMNYTPVLSTSVNGRSVAITLISQHTNIYEGTGVARESESSASKMATLNITANGQCSQQRMLLQQKLDGVVLNVSTAANIKSTLHAAEMTQNIMKTALCQNTTALSLSAFNLQKTSSPTFCVPAIAAIQKFSLNGTQSTNAKERQVMIQAMFYAVGLSCGIGPLFSVSMNNYNLQQAHDNMILDANITLKENAKVEAKTESKTIICPGTPFMQNLVPEHEFARIVVSAPCSQGESLRLRAMGACMGLNKLHASSFVMQMSKTFMPLHLRQSMTMCPARNALIPLSATQMRDVEKFGCGIFSKGSFVAPQNQIAYTSTGEIEANMHAMYNHTCNVIGCLPVITGTGFSDTMTIVYP